MVDVQDPLLVVGQKKMALLLVPCPPARFPSSAAILYNLDFPRGRCPTTSTATPEVPCHRMPPEDRLAPR